MSPKTKKPTIYTIGHSTSSFDELVELLKSHQIKMLVDIRTIPRSRTNPQFNEDVLKDDLPEVGMEYLHMTDLGGLRHSKAGSPNTVWKNKSFRGYADYMETKNFREAVDELVILAKKKTLAIMCSEAVWWRCHRSMVADELTARGIHVENIINESCKPHTLRSFAHVVDGHVSYRTE